MRRRDALAGLGSLAVLGAAGGYAARGLTTDGTGPPQEGTDGADDSGGPIEVETFDAPGSEAGTIPVPSGEPVLLEFFVTGCGNCQAQMPRLAEARERTGGEVTFLSVTFQTVGEDLEPEYLAEWWDDLEGNWYVGHDPSSELAGHYGVVGYPVTIVVDGDGEKRWDGGVGVKSVDEIVEGVETVL